jgi:DNA polymerase-3 subunit delta'
MLAEKRLGPWLRPKLAELENASRAERLGHAWIIAGPAGLGKLNLAFVAASRILSPSAAGAEPAALPPAAAVAAQRARHELGDHHPDLHPVFPEEDKTTISVEQIRTLTETLGLKSHGGGAKVVVIDPAESMTTAAANALLKSLEEPRPGTYLFLVSHRPGRLLATIRSRCQSLLVPTPSAEEIGAWLGGEGGTGIPQNLGDYPATPLLAAARIEDEVYSKYKDLSDTINSIYKGTEDPLSTAEQWAKQGPDLQLEWLSTRLQTAIHARLVPQGTNPVTVPGQSLSENPWNVISVGRLFELLDQSERLRDQLGSGVNVELALKLVLLGFLPGNDRAGQAPR